MFRGRVNSREKLSVPMIAAGVILVAVKR